MLRTAVAIGVLSTSLLSNVTKAQDLSVDASTTFASSYVTDLGSVLGKGPVDQTEVDLNVGKYFTASAWADYDFGDKAWNERDVYLTLHGNLFTIKNPILKGQVSGGISLQDWGFPSGIILKNDLYHVVGKISYKGIINADWNFYQLLNQGEGRGIAFNFSKPFEVDDIGKNTKVYLGPTFKTAYNNNYLGTNGFRHATLGVSLQMIKGPLNVELFAKHQFGLNGERTITYYGISISVNDIYSSAKALGNVLRKN